MESFEIIVVDGVDGGMRFALGDGGFIGRGGACRIRLTDPSVQPMHASIRVAGGKYILTDVSEGAGLTVNDLPVKSRPIQAHDRIKLGHVVLEVLPVAASEVAAAPAAAAVRGSATGKKPVARFTKPAGGQAGGASEPQAAVEKPSQAAQAPVADPGGARTPVWIISGVIAAIAIAVVGGLWAHLLSMRKEVEVRFRDVSEMVNAGRLTKAQALERYRGVLEEAIEVHPRMAENLKKMIRETEADMLAQQGKIAASLKELDGKADELAGKNDFAGAANLYRNADPSLKQLILDTRTARLAELDRLAAGQEAKGK